MTDTDKHLLNENSRAPLQTITCLSAGKSNNLKMHMCHCICTLCLSQSPWLFLGTLNRCSGLLISYLEDFSACQHVSCLHCTWTGLPGPPPRAECWVHLFSESCNDTWLLIIAFVICLPLCLLFFCLSVSVSLSQNKQYIVSLTYLQLP